MEIIQWGESFSVGVPALDEQHRQIIKLINTLIENRDAPVNSEIISETLTVMTRYASTHFKEEEALLAGANYVDLDDHHRFHVEFMKRTVSFCQDTMNQNQRVPDEVLHYLREWWMRHILEEDMKYKALLAETPAR